MLEIETLPIRLTADGRWLHGGEPMHPRVARLFGRCLVPDPDGRWHLEVGRERSPVEVDDTGLLVRSLALDETAEGVLTRARLTFTDDTEADLDPGSLEVSEEHVLYCRVVRHGLSVPCRFPPSLYHRLALHVEEAEGGFALRTTAGLFPLRPHDPAHRPG